jgi:hypothetical protein
MGAKMTELRAAGNLPLLGTDSTVHQLAVDQSLSP